MLEIQSLYFSYGRQKVLKGISHVFKRGAFTAVMGPNGCGKTTLVKNMAGLLSPLKGQIVIKGRSMGDFSLIELSRLIGYVPQKPSSLPMMTVTESVLAGRIPFISYSETKKDMSAAQSVISELGLENVKDRYVTEISGGELQKTLIAQALAREPELLLLDEPLNNLDMKNQFEIMKLIQQRTKRSNITAISVLHDLNAALKFCDELVLMKAGEIVFCSNPQKLSSSIVSDVFNVECEIINKDAKIYAVY